MFADVIEGINFIWNNKFSDAEKVFETKRESNPRYALHYAEVAFLRSFITADTSDTEMAVTRLKATKQLSENNLKHYEKGTAPPGVTVADKNELANLHLDCRVVLGDTLYMLAVLQLTRDSKLKGAFNMRKSWKVFEESLKIVKDSKEHIHDEDLVRCLNFGAGFFFFAMSIIPQKFLKLVELVGFRADRDLGLKYIRDCHDAGGVRAPFATIVLLFNNLLLPRGLANPAKYLREADSLIKESLVKYPEGSLIQVMGSHCARKQCNIDEGIKFMEDAIANCKSLNAPPLIYKYELANCFAMKLNWAEAAKHFEPLVSEEKFQVRALCALQLACCYHMTGDRDKSAALLGRIPSYIKKNSSVDPIVAHQAARYLSNGGWFSAFELLYLRRDLAKMERQVPEVLLLLEKQAANTNALKPVTADVNAKKGFAGFANKLSSLSISKPKKEEVDHSIDDRAAYLMIKGALLKSAEKVDDAIQCFREVIRLEPILREKYYVPYCLFELGESLYHKGSVKEAQEAMKKCNNISGYDWEDPLKVRLRVTIDQLKKGGVVDLDEDEDGTEVAGAGPSTPEVQLPPVVTAN
jgi:tetratricopeptide (TPR) repeat protein